MTEQDAINSGLRASIIFSGLKKKLDVTSCVDRRDGATPGLQPKNGVSVATLVSILLPFHTSSGTPQSEYLILRELTEGDSHLYVCGRLINPTNYAQGVLPTVSIECLKTEVGNTVSTLIRHSVISIQRSPQRNSPRLKCLQRKYPCCSTH